MSVARQSALVAVMAVVIACTTKRDYFDSACPELDLQSKQIADQVKSASNMCHVDAKPTQSPALLKNIRGKKTSMSKAIAFKDRSRALRVHKSTI